MSSFSQIFVVIDPTTDRQSALANAERIATGAPGTSLHVYEAIYSTRDNADPEALQRVETARHRAWIDTLVKPIRDQGIGVEVEIEWTQNWRDAIAPAAARAECGLIIKAASVHSGAERRFLKTADWTLLRNASCPVYLIKKDQVEEAVTVLVALDIQVSDDLHNTLNARVLEYGSSLAGEAEGSAIHVVNAYAGANKFVYPDDLAQTTGIDLKNAHSVEGSADTVIPEVAAEINADILVIGTAKRDGIKAAVVGNTAERILDAVSTNILTVTAE